VSGTAERARIDFILRSFRTEELSDYAALLREVCHTVSADYPSSQIELETGEQYRNMKEVLRGHPRVTQLAERAIREVGLEPRKNAIRGGTDGSRLSFMGLPCPNLFAGEHNFHSRYEWASVHEMKLAAEVMVAIARLNTEIT
jgi:tripeptide aminopeptidase